MYCKMRNKLRKKKKKTGIRKKTYAPLNGKKKVILVERKMDIEENITILQ